MSAPPSISVLMPVFNAGRTVADAVRSVLSQTVGDFELIAVDDGSTDGSAAILGDFAAGDRRVRVIRQANSGVAAALNAALGAAAGEFAARMDADDLCRPDRFARQLEFLGARPHCVLVGTAALLIDPDGLPICVKSDFPTDHAGIDAALMAGRWSFLHPSVMMRTAPLREIGGYRREFDFGEDHDLALRLAERGQLANLTEVLLSFRQHLSAVSVVRKTEQVRAVRGAIAQACRRRGLPEPAGPDEPPRARGEWEMHGLWAWRALTAGNLSTAWKHVFPAMRKRLGRG